jgi:glycosyltransferase involved in cell wall biosynthesis
LLDEGRRELTSLRPRASAVLTMSEFNAQELRTLGYRDVGILPLIVDPAVLRSTPPDPAMSERLRTQIEGPVLLYVGQILPHKRIEFLIKAFHILSTYLMPDANLIMVGPLRLAGYAAALQTQIDELHLERAWITDSVSQTMLAAFLQRADVFATGSEHEGFCVPLLEAMSFDLPFMARRFAAVPETAGPAGMLLDPSDGPAVAAEALAELVTDGTLRGSLIERGRRRLTEFDTEVTTAAWREALLSLT